MLPSQRSLFHLPDDLHYLNCAYMSPLARPVEEAGIEGMRRKRNPATVRPDDFFADGEAVRREFAGLLGIGAATRVALVPSASYGIATAARNLEVPAGSRIVLLHEQFPSNVYSWHRLAAERRAEVVTVRPPAGPGRGAAWNAAVVEAIDHRTSLVAVPHVHWADGTVFDLPAIAARARDVGAALIVDGTQSVGAYPFPFGEVRPDALVCAGYKWLLGPYSTGLAVFGPRFDGGVPLEENWISRRGSERFAGLVDYEPEYAAGAARYDVGERSNFILIPMLLASLRLVRSWGVDEIQATVRELSAPVFERARELGYGVEDGAHRAGHLFGIRAPAGVDLDGLRAALERRRISVSVRGDAIRVAPHVYNGADDIDALIGTLEDVAGGHP
jgi:selenocysteine lyase/cysteine desulfurase